MFATGVLDGSGTINTQSFFNVGGIVNPGGLQSVGTLTIEGDYIQSSQGSLILNWGADNAGDLLVVNGDVSLSGNVSVAPIAGFMPRFGDQRDAISYTGELVSDYSNLDGLPGVLYLSAIETEGMVSFQVEAASFASQTTFETGGQSQLASLLDQARDGQYDAMSDLFGAIDLLEGDALNAALSNVSPHEHFHGTRSALGNVDVLSGALSSSMQSLGGHHSSSMGKMAKANAGASVMGMMGASALNMAASSSAAQTGMDDTTRSYALGDNLLAFVSGGGINGEINTARGVESGDLSGGYGLIGLESRVHDNWVVGAALGMADTDSKQALPGGGHISGSMQSKQVFGYARYNRNDAFAFANISYADHDGDHTKIASVGGALFQTQADIEGNTLGYGLGAGYQFSSSEGNWHLIPQTSLQYGNSSFDQYSSSGGATALTYNGEDDETLVARLGFEVKTTFTIAGADFTPSVYLGGARDMSADGDNLQTAFAASSSNVATYYTELKEARSWSEFAVGLNARFADDFSMMVSYEDQVASNEHPVQSDRLSLTIRKSF